MLPNLNPNALPLPFHHNGVTQVGILVPDLDAAVEYYHRLFDIGPWHFYTYERPLVSEMTYRGEPADYSRGSRCRTARRASAYPACAASLDEFIEAHGYGVQHFGLYVPSMTEARTGPRRRAERLMDGRGFGPMATAVCVPQHRGGARHYAGRSSARPAATRPEGLPAE